MSFKLGLLENRVENLERYVFDMHKVVHKLQKKLNVKVTEERELLASPPADPDLRGQEIQ